MRAPHRKTAALSLYSCFFSNYNQLYDSMPYGTFFVNIFYTPEGISNFFEKRKSGIYSLRVTLYL